MNKLFRGIVCAAVCCAALAGACACGGQENEGDRTTVSVYAPDGAPALALAGLIAGEADLGGQYEYDVHIVDPNSIRTYVTGVDPAADFCVMPVNLAAKLLGTGETYRMLGTVTNGNLYFLRDGSKELPELTADNLSEALLGETLGVIQYDQVPGLTLRVVLEQNEIPYTLAESGGELVADKVNIRSLAPAQVVPATGCDYYLCPEPACTTKIGATQGKLLAAGSLQELYGAGGYPQAVLVGRRSFLENNRETTEKVITYFKNSGDFLANTDAKTLDGLLADKRTEGMEAAFSEAQLNPTVIANCSVRFTAAADCKEAVTEFLGKLKKVSADATEIPSDAFFYTE